ncbi:MAG: CpaF family protein [Deltaproteobacteria bacterium]|nr:CpaF family protein [Deltaproteobacteria bacterium]
MCSPGQDKERPVDAPLDLDVLKRSVHEKLLESIDFKKLDTEVGQDSEKTDALRRTVAQKISEILDQESGLQDRHLRAQIVKEVLQEALGLGPLEDLLADGAISEIMVNSWNEIFVEKKGRLTRIDKKFFSEQHLINIISRITAPLGRKIDTSTPMVDARLKDGSRVNAIIPPLAVKGACLTIRKFPEDRIGVAELIKFGALNTQMVEFLKTAVLAKLNILISGGTGSGKTTLLNILSGFIPENERIITIEDSAELQLRQPHVVTLESRPANIEGKGEVFIRDLVKNSLRMRPDRIVIGECRGAEALDMLQAMNTGHDGSLTTIHSNSSREALSRLETLVMYAGFELPVKAIKEQIVGAIDLIVQVSRFKDGSRKVIQISEVDGMQGEVITLGDVFVYRQRGEEKERVVGEFAATGYVPQCIERFSERGLHIPREVFWTSN